MANKLSQKPVDNKKSGRFSVFNNNSNNPEVKSYAAIGLTNYEHHNPGNDTVYFNTNGKVLGIVKP